MISTIIAGNGLGMALDSSHFDLQAGIIEGAKQFSEEEKKLIRLGSDQIPTGEGDLEHHHLISSACKTLINYQNKDLGWLSPDGKSFPNIYLNFIYQVSKHFFEYEGKLPEKFVNNLSAFINECDRCHIATLNYDKLLYEALIEAKILSGYQDKGLVDGIYFDSKDGFSAENLIRIHYNFGWYLHLHGSPVFRTSYENLINKCNINTLPQNAMTDKELHNHIVLAHSKLKPAIISKSSLLDTYFDFFVRALSESHRLYLFGYSGLDDHVNLEIKEWISNKKDCDSSNIYIIEWKGNGTDDERKLFWEKQIFPQKKVSFNLNIIRLENILEYYFPIKN